MAEESESYQSYIRAARTFSDHEAALLTQHRGRFVLIRGAAIYGAYDTHRDAMEAAVCFLHTTDVSVFEVGATAETRTISTPSVGIARGV